MLTRGTCANHSHGRNDSIEPITRDQFQSRQLIGLCRFCEIVDLQDCGLGYNHIEDIWPHKIASHNALDPCWRKEFLCEGVHRHCVVSPLLNGSMRVWFLKPSIFPMHR